MPLHPSARAFLDNAFIRSLAPPETLSVEAARAQYNRLMRAAPPGDPVARIEDLVAPGPLGVIPLRVFTPFGEGPFPLYVFFHGGGWVLGDLDTQVGECRTLASQAGCVVVSVDYRHAPEHRFPAAPEDAYAALEWVAQNAERLSGDPARLAVGGTSSGGNLAAVAALMARDRGGPRILLQVLNTPVTHHDFSTASYRENGQGYGFDRSSMEWCWSCYLKKRDDGLHPYASPLLAPDLSGLPAAFVMTCEFDPLRDEGRAYAERLRAAGVPVTYRENAGMVHLFHGADARQAVIQAVRQAFFPTTFSER